MTDASALACLATYGVLPVATVASEHESDILAAGLIRGGLPIVEITLRTTKALNAIRSLATRGDILVGAGTVTSATQVDEAIDAGARFVVSPGLVPAVVERCLSLGIAVIPGVATATEVLSAHSLGVKTLKLFPAAVIGGSALVAALADPIPDARFVVSGGIRPEDLRTYLNLPSVLAVAGSWMVRPTWLARGDIDAIDQAAASSVAAARQARTA